MATKKDIEDFMAAEGQGEYLGAFGPNEVLGFEVWEVWVWEEDEEEEDGGDYETRFVAVHKGGRFQYFDDFQGLCAFVTKEHRATLDGKLTQVVWEKRARFVVSAIVFLAATATVIYKTVISKQESSGATIILWSVVASGSAFYFGRWIPVGTKIVTALRAMRSGA